jgi:hypothetical protein
VRRALAYEIERQKGVLLGGGALRQETRRWDEAAGQTFAMRTKEVAHDYRYFPDPDLMPVRTGDFMDEVRRRVPELPAQKRERFVREYGVSRYDAGVLASDLALSHYYERAVRGAAKGSARPKQVANWVLNDLQSALKNGKIGGGNRGGEGAQTGERHGGNRGDLRPGARGEPESGGGVQGRQDCIDQFPEGPGDEAFPGEGESERSERGAGEEAGAVGAG